MTYATTSSRPASDAQLKFIRALVADRTEVMAARGLTVTEYQLLTLSSLGASRFIDNLKALPRDAGAKSGAGRQVHPDVKPGMYLMDRQVIKVIPSQKADGRLYVAVLTPAPEGEASSFKAKGNLHLLYRLTPEHEMSREQAAVYGAVFGRCACCGKLLTVPESVEKGVGPVCWDKYFA